MPETGPLIGHRGVAARAPENTLASLTLAAALGLTWVEFDVRLSRDGHPVLFHDDRLGRTTDGRGRVADHDLAALRRLDAGKRFPPPYRGERIPTLVEAIELLVELGIGANVEIKPDPERETETAQAVMATLARCWPETLPAPIVSSFRPRALAVASAASPACHYALLVDAVPKDWHRRLAVLGATALHCNARRLTGRQAAEIADQGVPLRAYTVNSARMARRLFAWGVAAVFTDDPVPLAAAFGSRRD
ncbi:MAG: glycerophosphoryl diester phosphodiesterase [Rhodospirillales bacterium]|nr:MAG: glycerophosphoryl diester phosphodiesterase [Rhodospirillales bacterium]